MPPQLRQDLLSNEWVCIAPDRLKKPHSLIKPAQKNKTPKSKCPFENLDKSENKILVKTKDLIIIENKFPAFSEKNYCPITEQLGPHKVTEAVGYHEVLIIKDHDKNISDLGIAQLLSIFKMIQERMVFFQENKCVKYVSVFQNWGEQAGASVYHPHFQLIAIPVVPNAVLNLLEVSKKFYNRNKKCVHCHLIKWEKNQKRRIIYENKGAIAMAPFASKEPFLIRIFSKKHISNFERTPEKELVSVLQVLSFVLKKLKYNLGDLGYNLHIRTTPINSGIFTKYHWYFEITTKLTKSAGFEENTNIEINPMDPIDAVNMILK